MSKLKILILALLVVAFSGAVAVAEAAPEAVAVETAPQQTAEAPADSPFEGPCADAAGRMSSDLPAELRPSDVGSFEDTRENMSQHCVFVSYDCYSCPGNLVKGCNKYRCYENGKFTYKLECSGCGNFC